MTKRPALTLCKNIFKDPGILTFPAVIIKECCLSVTRNLTMCELTTEGRGGGVIEKSTLTNYSRFLSLHKTYSRRYSVFCVVVFLRVAN